MKDTDRIHRIMKEREFWDSQRPVRRITRFLNSSKLFFSQERNDFAFNSVRERLLEALRQKGCNSDSLVLNVPCGAGNDLKYILPLTKKVICVDITFAALKILKVNFQQPCVEGDALKIPVKDCSIDYVLVNNFLRHVIDEGLHEYLKEFYRVLRPGGWLVLPEVNILFPIFWFTRPIHKLFPGFSGMVEHERPLNPFRLIESIREVGFLNIEVEASSYIHNRFYLPVSKIIYRYQPKLRELPFFKWFGYSALVCGQKQNM